MMGRIYTAYTLGRSLCKMLSWACWNFLNWDGFLFYAKGKKRLWNAWFNWGKKALLIWIKGKCWLRLELQKHNLAAVLVENKVILYGDPQLWQNVLLIVSCIQDGVTFSPSWTVLYKMSMISTCCLKKPRSKLSEKLWSRSAVDSVLSSRCCDPW